MPYKPPTADALEELKKELGYSSNQMAKLFGLADGRQWRRYTSQADDPKNRREMGMHMLFFAMARLELNAEVIEQILERMRKVGATIDLNAEPAPQAHDGDTQP